MAEVAVGDLRKSFGRTEVLKGVSVAVSDGEMMVVLGPSGCGKSTFLRLVAGLEAVTAGEVRIGGRVVNQLEPKDRDIAMVFQTYALYPHMSVYDNMAYGLRNRRTPRKEIDRRVREAARALGLAELLDRKPRQLSGGQRQRAAMGRAIVREPAVFLFDEPLSNLDAALRTQMRLEIRQLQSRLRTTGIYVTHDQVEAMTLADRILLLNAGQVEQVGPPLEIYARPASRFVAGFLGSPAMSFLEGRVGEDGRSVAVRAASLPLSPARPADAGREVTVGIRPEQLRPDATGRPALTLAVRSVEALGADTFVHGQLASGADPVTVRLDGAARPRPGDLLPLALPAGALHLFDVADGRRLPDA